MPAELFKTVNVRRSSSGRKLGAVPLSIAIHAAVLVAAVTIPLLATDVLPMPQVPVVIQLPPMPAVAVPDVPPPRSAVRPTRPIPAVPTVPVVAPNGIPTSEVVPRPPELIDVPASNLPPSIGTVTGSGLDDFVPPPKPEPKPVGPLRVSSTQMPRKIHNEVPVYPPVAIAAKVQGTVVVEAIISTTGIVQDAKVISSPSPLLDQAALDAVRRWVFTPTLLNGTPVPIILTVRVDFTLQ